MTHVMSGVLAAPEQQVTDIAAPTGWEITEGIADSAEQRYAALDLRENVSIRFPMIAEAVEQYIADTYDDLDILVTNAVIAVHADETFQILLLVKQEDFFSPRLNAAKLHAKMLLNTIGDGGMQYKFILAIEYFKSYDSQYAGKLRYCYKNPQSR